MAQLKTIILRKLEGTRAQLFEVTCNLNDIGSTLTFNRGYSCRTFHIDNAELYQKIASANQDVQRAKGKLATVMQELSGKKGVTA